VTLRARRLPAPLRHRAVFRAVRAALCRASKEAFRVLHFSVQRDHLHLLVEADAGPMLARGVQGLAVRVARAVNRVLGRRGTVWDDRYHARSLRTPREVRNALAYVLHNWRHHVPGSYGLDPCSSAAWFGGWRTGMPPAAPSPLPVARTWLARLGWRRAGPIDVGVPRSAGCSRASTRVAIVVAPSRHRGSRAARYSGPMACASGPLGGGFIPS
jgi:hypothetical protein